jgi:hypothetical protein
MYNTEEDRKFILPLLDGICCLRTIKDGIGALIPLLISIIIYIAILHCQAITRSYFTCNLNSYTCLALMLHVN